LDGEIKFRVTNVNTELNEIAGVFVQKQPSDTDMGSKTPKTLLIQGKFYAKIEDGK
jgi:photosystem II oxygen-evolving enhancer protein 1